MYYFKYPRTMHFPWSLGSTSDDKFMENTASFVGKDIVCTLKMDGENCVGPDTFIVTSEGKKTIKEICENNIKPYVLSFDIDTNKCEFSKIVETKISESVNDWFLIETEDGTTLEITGEHYVYLPELNIYRQVKDLTENDVIKFLQ